MFEQVWLSDRDAAAFFEAIDDVRPTVDASSKLEQAFKRHLSARTELEDPPRVVVEWTPQPIRAKSLDEPGNKEDWSP